MSHLTDSTAADDTADNAFDGVEDLLAELIRFDTSNYGGGKSAGERECAEYVVALLTEWGYSPQIFESAERRTNVVVRIAGADPDAPAVLAHAHLDVVPASAAEWSVPPFSGEIRDGCVWGRGAIDMKDMAAMLLSVLRFWSVSGERPAQDLVVAFVADEEDDGEFGARYLVREHPSLFEGCVVGISESGGWTYHVNGLRIYPIAAGERGSLHMKVTAHGQAGHGSRPNPENPVTMLISALQRVASYEWPVRLTPVVLSYIEKTSEALGVEIDLDDIDATLDRLGAAGDLVRGTIRNISTPTMLDAGYKVNVIPSTASAYIDVRALPGTEGEVLETIDSLLGKGIVRTQLMDSTPMASPIDTPWFEAMGDAIRAFDPEAVVVPYCMGGGTDAKAFAELGIVGYGFSPLYVPPDLQLRLMAHGVDERCPVEGLHFGARVLDHFLRNGHSLRNGNAS